MVVTAETVCVNIAGVRFSANEPAVCLTIVLLGPLPAVAVSTCAVTVDAVLRRLDLRLGLLNFAAATTVCFASSVVFELAESTGSAVPGEAGLPLTVLAMVLVQDLVGVAALWLVSHGAVWPGRGSLRLAHAALLPWTAANALITAGAAHMYFTLGSGVIWVLLGVQLSLSLLLLPIERSTRLDGDLRAAQAERERMAATMLDQGAAIRRDLIATLHEDAVQTLLAARQDLAELRAGETSKLQLAEANLDAGLSRLRELMADGLIGIDSGDSPLSDGLERALSRLEQKGVRCQLRVTSAPIPSLDLLLLQIGTELINNAAKHASASTFSLSVEANSERVFINAADDGVGFDPSALGRKLNEGHVGLALVRARARELNGTLHVDSAIGRGTFIAVELVRGEEERPLAQLR
jgi:signal transduction histidine kinase